VVRGGGSCNNTGKTRGGPAEKWRGSFLVGGLTHPKGKLRGNPKPDPVREISWVVPPPPPLWADLQEGGGGRGDQQRSQSRIRETGCMYTAAL